jgi:hypothetical protein
LSQTAINRGFLDSPRFPYDTPRCKFTNRG